MKQISNNNNYQSKLDQTPETEIKSKSLGNLDNLLLEKVFLGQDIPLSTSLSPQLSSIPPAALYISEIDNKFYFLDYTTQETNPQPKAIEASNLGTSQLLVSPNSNGSLSSASDTSKTSKTKFNWLNSSLLVGKKGLFLGLGLGIVLSLGATRLTTAPNPSDRGDSVATTGESSVPPQAVTVSKVATTNIDSSLDATGTVTAYESIPVMSQASGLQIVEILADRGDTVQQGQVLAKLNNQALQAQQLEAEAAVAQAQASLDELKAGTRTEEIAQGEARVASANSALIDAQSNLELIQKRVERNRTLAAQGAITRDRFDEVLNQEKTAQAALAGAKANLQEAQEALTQLKAGSRRQTIAQAAAQLTQAQGRLQAIEAQLSDTTIIAPAKGLIVEREARVGQTVAPGDMLFSIVQDGRLELRLQIPETLITKIQPGQKVTISSNVDPNLKLIGKVREIDPAVDDASRQAVVKVDLPNNTNLKPGMFLRAGINTDRDRGLAVPIAALIPQSGNQATAFVVQEDNTVTAKTVQMGEILGEQQVEITQGLQSGDRVVLKGAAYLKDGDRVNIVQDEVK